VTNEERARLATLDPSKNVVWLIVLALTVLVVVISSSRARAARDARAEEEAARSAPLPAHELTPVPVSAELTGAPTKPPPSFVSAFASAAPRTNMSPSEESAIVARARLELTRVSVYDSSWMETSSYPMGDVPQSRGACTDVVVRSLRAIGVDLQELVHDDIVRDMQGYGVSAVDTNIDHRRLSTMFTFFSRNAMALSTNVRDKAAWRAGDVVFVAWQWGRGAPPEHVGIVSDRLGPRGYPLIIENGGPRPIERDSLGRGKVVGHFRALKKP
jgi:uncharacterized protein